MDYWAAYNLSHRHYDNVYFGNDPAPIQTTGFEADYQTGLAIDFLEKKSPQPFYLYLSFVAPHSPFTPPARHDIYDPAKLHLRPNVPNENEPSARKDLAGYYVLCSAVDENIGRLLKALDDRGLAEDTIVVFTSDHGETLGSHGIDAIDLPFEESSRIPLLIRYPRRIRPGSTIHRLISNVDYAPTLLSLCAVKAPQGMQGVNLASLLTHGRGPSANAVFAEGDLGAPGEWRMAVRGFDKVVVDSAFRPTHHFHLQPDPFELHNLVTEPSRPKQRRELVALIRRWVARTPPR